MTEEILKIHRNQNPDLKFTILIPSWNLFSYLRLCIDSLRKNSSFQHQIIVIVNEGKDGTLEWVEKQSDLDYVFFPENMGVCLSLNACRSLIATEFVVFANDDMYFLPGWDSVLYDEILRIGHKRFMLSSTMIESSGHNPCCVIRDFGTSPETFRESELLANQKELCRNDWSGSSWPPNILSLDCWDLVGGMSIEFSPGMASDDDLARKMWEIGVRTFIGKGGSLVYHFGCRSTKRVKKNLGYKTFTLKWGVSARTFMEKQLLRGRGAAPALTPYKPTFWEGLLQFFKRIKSCF
jgi:glycosyltransferase involved in cell wall biosynthesis